jgi:hypothetical protein
MPIIAQNGSGHTPACLRNRTNFWEFIKKLWENKYLKNEDNQLLPSVRILYRNGG